MRNKKMSEICPISSIKINEKSARLSALFVILSVLLFLFTPIKWVIYFLIADFSLRASGNAKYSPIAFSSKKLTELLKLKPSMTDAAPKTFAAGVGTIFCVVIAILNSINLMLFANIFAGMLLLCATLELSLGYCVGCKIYSIFCKIRATFWS